MTERAPRSFGHLCDRRAIGSLGGRRQISGYTSPMRLKLTL